MKLKHTVLLLLALLAAQTARAATITVTSTADSGPGSLRAALASAVDGDTIDATGVSGTIRLTSGELLVGKSLTILGSGRANLAVDGNFPNTTNRVFHIGSNTVVSISDLTITNGRIYRFSYPHNVGGGIWNEGALTVNNSTFSGNDAVTGGGIANYGRFNGSVASTTVSNSTFSGNNAGEGGGIFNARGMLTVHGSTFSDNSADRGGGIDNVDFGAVATVLNCTFCGNSATLLGGGIYNDSSSVEVVNSILSGNSAFVGGGICNLSSGNIVVRNSTISGNTAAGGGGIVNDQAMLTITGSTVSGNTAEGFDSEPGLGGGIANFGGTLAIEGSTLSGNVAAESPAFSDPTQGGGIWNGGMVTVQSSMFSGNSANLGGGICNDDSSGVSASLEIGSTILNAGASGGNITNLFSGTVTSLGYNLSSDDGGGLLTATGDLINANPLLGPLADNGGPTMTMALLPGSPCINAGDPGFVGPPEFDQRGTGFPRLVGGRIDIGAFEVQPPADSDGDGVPDPVDECSNTPPGEIVNSTGCSIAQLVPCDGPRSGGKWKNHGQYVRAVVKAARDFRKAGLITRRQWAQIVKQAAHSRCGWKRHSDHDGDSERDRDRD